METLVAEEREISFNTRGLNQTEQDLVRSVAFSVFLGALKCASYSLRRCTFFADIAYEPLVKSLEGIEIASNSRIEGDDENPFDQHYWLAFNLLTEGGGVPEVVLIDPIFGYLGLEKFAGDKFPGWTGHLEYYRRKRIVPWRTPVWEGGVRIKTIGI
ncbi:hypothetical protein HY386_01260 [Candidatus Daviesbacteria bacterium]|nr:hypothetical protein [Candidatus Daviesbacteria bacterium]